MKKEKKQVLTDKQQKKWDYTHTPSWYYQMVWGKKS